MFERTGYVSRHAGRGGLALLLALTIVTAPVVGFGALPAARSTLRAAGDEPAAGLVTRTGRGTFAAEEGLDAGTLLLGSGHRFDPLLEGEPPVADALTSAAPGPGEIASYLVQLHGPVMAGQRQQLEASGASIFAYIPHHAFLVRMRAAQSATVEALPFVRWVGAYQPAYKLSGQDEMQSVSGPGTLVVLLFPDADLAAARAALQSMGGTIEEATDSGRNKILRVTLDMSSVPELAGRGDVAWVEPWHQPTFDNAIAQWVVQTNVLDQRRVWDMGLHGEGQVVHISDSGIRTSHNAFRDNATPITTFGQYPTHRKVIAYLSGRADVFFGDDAGASNHGTHVAGTVAGDDSPFAADPRDGHALKAKIYFTDVGKNTTSVFTPSDMNLLFSPAYAGNAGGAARISTNSWGSPVNEYDVQAMTIDQFMSDHPDFLVLFATGNSAGPGTVGSPAGNKDGLGIGNCQNGANANQKSATSSEGPAADGRLKPTVMAPGQGILSADGAGDAGYKSLTGTSMATPAAAGATALVRQYLTEGWYPTGTPVPANAIAPSAALLKAMVITSTDNDMLAHNIPDNTVGWGRIKLDNILYFPGDAARTALVDEADGLATGEFAEYEVNVTDPTVPLKITLCWTDREAAPGAGPKIVNDLDLTVTDPGNTVYLGNVFAGGQSLPTGSRDLLNVEEGVRRNAPAAGVWKIRVSGASVPFAPQPFALAISGGVGAASGIVRLDRQSYGRSDVIEVRLEDLDATGPVQVTAISTTETVPETITLTGGSGVFTASIPTTSFAPQSGDGTLSVSHGDQITVTYTDASPAGVSSAGASARFDGPVITGVATQAVGLTQTIAWTTDARSRSRVLYGTSPALGQASALDPALVTSHSVMLTGLLPETQYWFDVEATDHGGNATRDDHGGQHYRFATGKQGEVLVAVGEGSFTNTSLYTTALLERGWNPAVLAGGTLTSLPLGNRDAGLRSYLAVLWQSGLEQYPPLENASRAALTDYLDGGGRLAATGHDIAWALTDVASGHGDAERAAWLANTLHLQFVEDPAAGWVANQGVPGDPIGGAYTTGVAYAPHRQGASGDEVTLVPGTGSGSYTWTNTDATPGSIGFRWENGVPNGNPVDALWGGTPSRLVYNGFEWSHIVDAAARADILDKTVIWLIGRDHPDVTVTSPNGGEVITSGPVSVSWTEAAFGGATVTSRSLFYSRDGGSSWNLITNGAGGSPYLWDVSALPNGAYRVRVEIGDNGVPPLSGRDGSNADFTLNRPGGDTEGPVVVAGSIKLTPNPVDNQTTATITATLTDVGHGGANVTAAEFSWGESPAPAGSGLPMSGSFAAATVGVSASVPAGEVPTGDRTFWVRGRDAGLWGPATGRAVVVNGSPIVGVGADLPVFALHPSIPNPAAGSVRIGFALPQAGPAALEVYGLRGERVRTLKSGILPAGRQDVIWDGRDEAGRAVPSGVYFYRLVAGPQQAKRKVVFIR
jgi:subtilase family protein/flagellar hook capping protein FlgD